MNPAYSSIALAVFSLLSLFLYPCFLPSRTYADDPLPINPSLTIGSSGTLAFDVNPGSFAYGRQDITVLTTNYTGYTLTAVPNSNDSRLVNSVTSSYITSIIEDSTSSNFGSNEYGFSTDSTITGSTTYHPVTTSTTIKETNSATTTSQTGTFQLTIGAKAGSNAPAGTYSRTFTLTAVANPIAFAITYNANAGQDTVTNMPSPNPQTTGEVVGTNLTLSSATPTRTGYKFLGWATTSSATEPTYQPGGSYSLDQTTGNITTLYAICAEPLQNWNDCSSLNVGDVKYLYDTRDNQTYRVTKWYMDTEPHDATNARCWMMDNLNLGAETLVVNTLDSSNTHLPSNGAKNITATTFNSWKKTHVSEAYTTSEFIPITASNSYNGADADSYGSKYGTLYNYAAATAGTYAYGSNESRDATDAKYDICPSGWRLPTSGSSGEFKQLMADGYGIPDSEDGLIAVQSTLKFPLAGAAMAHVDNGYPYSQGSWGSNWASTWKDTDTMIYMFFGYSRVHFTDNFARKSATAVRCIKQDLTHSLTVNYGTGVSGVTIDGIAVANGTTIEMEEGVSHNINMTFSSGYEFGSWSATSGTLGSASTQSTTYTIGSSNATLTAKATAPLQTWNDCNSMRIGETIEL
ncbi:InlB B-repeat-containing protein, partial [Candidatus Saccharibacteria bacterium]|nr:InlB B-repeat-containing protein [Candidatus Saccharibacteria bacterium]